MTRLTAIVYIAQHKAAANASKSPSGRNSRPPPLLKIMHATPAIATPDPMRTPVCIFCLKTRAMRNVVKSGEIEARRETFPAVVSLKA
jgi:hypothetical protein